MLHSSLGISDSVGIFWSIFCITGILFCLPAGFATFLEVPRNVTLTDMVLESVGLTYTTAIIAFA